jgi:hypothetical protein
MHDPEDDEAHAMFRLSLKHFGLAWVSFDKAIQRPFVFILKLHFTNSTVYNTK